MKRFLTCTLSVILLLTGLVGLLTPAASAADTMDEVQKAVVETAMAYYWKGRWMQYDSIQLTSQPRAYGDRRCSVGDPPEWAAADNYLYNVCSDFAYTVVWNAIGYPLTGTSRKCITMNLTEYLDTSTPGVVFHTGGTAGAYDAQAALASKDLLQPGDIVTYYDNVKHSGHAGVYVGDYFGDGRCICNCGGKAMDRKTGVDVIETTQKNALDGGAIRLDGFDVHWFTPNTYAYLGTNASSFSIIRPSLIAKAEGLQPTDAAKARIKYKGIDVRIATNFRKYDSLQTGDKMTVTLTVTNHGGDAFGGVTVSIPAPIGAQLDAASVKGGTLSGGAITATLSVPAGETATVSYDATVTAQRGGDVTVPSATVAGALTTRDMTYRVGGKPWTEANAQVFKDAIKDAKTIKALTPTGDIGFANAFYGKYLGVDLALPADMKTLRDGLATWTKVEGAPSGEFSGQMLVPKKDGELTDDMKRVRAMLLPEHLAGYAVYLRESLTDVPLSTAARNRVLIFEEQNYQPGDIFMAYTSSSSNRSIQKPVSFVYLGDGKVAGVAEGAKTPDVLSFKTCVETFLKHDFFVALRPSQAYDDVNTLVGSSKPLPFTDVTEADWFYTYVKDLYNDGTVNGMTPTTFVPKGNLTYGQALKLIVCALGHGEQASTGGHWASGYLKFAQDKGWIAGDVDLNGNVTRLAFCPIAAKAKNLTEQPA
ncbi:MAG: DUF11 domain-containing protein, partial [Oscillospiraceae bacterium]|nr:DUF11 domain-containing protein [Oscillospiraceae bacterium]